MMDCRASSALLDDDDADGRGGGTAWDGDFWVDTEAQQQLGSMFEVLSFSSHLAAGGLARKLVSMPVRRANRCFSTRRP
jgi:hypothetical protein